MINASCLRLGKCLCRLLIHIVQDSAVTVIKKDRGGDVEGGGRDKETRLTQKRDPIKSTIFDLHTIAQLKNLSWPA